jgi:hypothetical protein
VVRESKPPPSSPPPQTPPPPLAGDRPHRPPPLSGRPSAVHPGMESPVSQASPSGTVASAAASASASAVPPSASGRPRRNTSHLTLDAATSHASGASLPSSPSTPRSRASLRAVVRRSRTRSRLAAVVAFTGASQVGQRCRVDHGPPRLRTAPLGSALPQPLCRAGIGVLTWGGDRLMWDGDGMGLGGMVGWGGVGWGGVLIQGANQPCLHIPASCPPREILFWEV